MIARNILIGPAASEYELGACYAIRQAVFVVEQGVDAGLERDSYDTTAIHLLARLDGEPVGTARALVQSGKTIAKIGRVAVLPKARGAGIGARLMQGFLKEPAMNGVTQFELHAQIQAKQFYERLGYSVSSEPFSEAGIPHVAMKLLR
jgi:predicted GNAT family N-acyltransferase